MPLYKGIYYADTSTPMSIADITAAQATSIGDAIQSLPTQVANATERDAAFPTPVQGNSVWRMDKMWEEHYFGEYNAVSNPQGVVGAGWYPVSGKLPSVSLTTPGTWSISTTVVNFYTLTALYNYGWSYTSGSVGTGVFSPPFNGLYSISMWTTFAASANSMWQGISVNGVTKAEAISQTQTIGSASNVTALNTEVAVVKLLSTDSVRFLAWASAATNFTGGGMSLRYLGPG